MTALARLLDASTPAAVTEAEWDWHGVPLPMRVSAHLTTPALPEELITSVRCLVGVGDAIVVCETPLDVHVMPGGRREPGESLERTAVREVREETGWSVPEDALVPLGFLHFEHRVTPPADYPFPSPHFLQLIYSARLPAGTPAPVDWSDTEGWERHSRLVARADLAAVPLDALQVALAGAHFAG